MVAPSVATQFADPPPGARISPHRRSRWSTLSRASATAGTRCAYVSRQARTCTSAIPRASTGTARRTSILTPRDYRRRQTGRPYAGFCPGIQGSHRRPSIYDVRCRTPLAVYPETGRAARNASCLTLLRARFTQPARSLGLLVVSYTTVSPLPEAEASGGLLSVALSRGLLRVGVTHRPALWSPDVPRCLLTETTRPSHRPVCKPKATRRATRTELRAFLPRPLRAGMSASCP